MADPEPLLVLRGVSKSFGGIQAVSSITFDVAAGESVGLVGPNGAGKTTLFNCVCGQLRPDGGDIVFDGTNLAGLPTYKRARLGIGRTYQRVEVFTDMSVRDHLMVAERARRGEGRLWRDLLNLSKPTPEELERVRGDVGPRRHRAPGRHLGQRTRAWATAAWSSWPGPWPPSRRSCWRTSLPPGSTCTRRRRWRRSCARCSANGARPCSWSSTTSRWWPTWSDRTVVMDLGAMLARGHLRRGHGESARAGRLPRADGDAVTVTVDDIDDRTADGSDVLSVRHVSAGYGPYRALFDVSFRVPEGGVVALVGSNGAGKSTVARTVTGLVTATSGRVFFSGRDVTGLPAYKIARLGMAHVVEGRGVFSSLTVEENLTLAFRQRDGRGKLHDNLERAYVAFPILGERRRQLAGTLSGGQQRLLSLAKVLVVPSKVLVADELSLGLAPVVVDAVYEGLEEINRNGTALVVVEQQVNRVLRLANWAVVLNHGSVVYEGDPAGAGKEVDALIARREEAVASGVADAEE